MVKKVLDKGVYTFRNKFMYKNDPPIILAGLGRCGTTLTTNAIRKTRGYSYQFVADINTTPYLNKHIYKTHDYPRIEDFPENIKVIFMFGNVVDTIISLSKRMNRYYDSLSQVYHTESMAHAAALHNIDGLKLEELFDAWYRPQNFPMITIRYETLFSENTQELFSDFLGFKANFPPYKKRTTNQSSYPYLDSVIPTYESLSRKIELAEDCKIWE